MISHLNKKNKPTIVDISKKKITSRVAIAQGIIQFSKPAFKKIETLKTKKGEIKSIAIIAGILGAKKTSELIPLCHNIEIENIDIDIETIKKTSSLKIISFVNWNMIVLGYVEGKTIAVLIVLVLYLVIRI